MILFGFVFILYFIKLSEGNSFHWLMLIRFILINFTKRREIRLKKAPWENKDRCWERKTLCTFTHVILLLATLQFHQNETIKRMKRLRWNSSVIRQKGESQNGCFKKRKHAKFSEKRRFLTLWYAPHKVL